MRSLQVPAMTQVQALLVVLAGVLVMGILTVVLWGTGLPMWLRIWLPGLPGFAAIAVVKRSPKKAGSRGR